ncbi:NADAR family protein [Flavobacterium oreochromis]|uniref:Swarming motility protein YbiA n=1 Tax=Flavobacterium columnare TaxID=996 RepID=A0A246GEF2_9FLAO|nr:NADAR family protein [Flavobacterium oreochromis]OWP78908.1 Swarming motility protein YbiA [Flavobacterium oreochromis]POR29455.1 Swarming motility protein YbiA [Flavobacterium columnare]
MLKAAFSNYSVKLKGKTWKTSEHYFQAQKFENKNYQNLIANAASPMKAAELGRSRKEKIKQNWDNIKDNVMYEVLKAKFTQHQELKELLIQTKDAILVEHTENDSYWGDSGDGSGKNKLGKILMKIREEINEVNL